MKGSSCSPIEETSQPPDVLLSVSRGAGTTMGAQIEQQLRQAIRSGTLHSAARLPSTRELARQIGVSRRVVVGAYAQLAAEGYLTIRQGAAPRVAEALAPLHTNPASRPDRPPRPLFDFRPNKPDLSAFPRQAWARRLREAVLGLPTADLDYADLRGLSSLRHALADYLGRVRGVVADPARIVITTGYAQGRALVLHALAAGGAHRIAVEDPSHSEQRTVITHAGLEVIPVPVDEAGLCVEALWACQADAVVVTPAHQYPTGAVLSGQRRGELAEWLRATSGLVIEDDYDAEYRYDRSPVGAVQGIEPDHVVYAGSVSKTLAPALRIGWLVLPGNLLEPVLAQKRLADLGSNHIEQQAFASFLNHGDLDRHLRQMRGKYRKRRDALVQALRSRLPETSVHGIAAGLHATVILPTSDNEPAIIADARRHGIALTGAADYRIAAPGPPALLLGYAQHPEPTIRAGVAATADSIRRCRTKRSAG